MTPSSIYPIALTMINGVGDMLARSLLQTIGDAAAVFSEKKQTLERIPGIGAVLAAEIKRPEVLRKAEQELAFIEKNNLSCYFIADPDYPFRLRECADAPVLFYFKGHADLDARHILSIVGTRHATEYGRELTEALLYDLSVDFPDLLIVSGLAYGIDICAHRNALRNGLPTVAVLAHGLDRIYPSVHRETAVEMLQHGGLLSDFPSGTQPDKPHFIRRNRIVAGLADATIVMESAEKGGSLITADLAFSYGREVFAFPGRVKDVHSAGCHRLIRENKAALITSAADLVALLGWDVPAASAPEVRQTELIFSDTFSQEELAPVWAAIRENGEIHTNRLVAALNMPVQKLSALLFELEIEGRIKSLPGNRYKVL